MNLRLCLLYQLLIAILSIAFLLPYYLNFNVVIIFVVIVFVVIVFVVIVFVVILIINFSPQYHPSCNTHPQPIISTSNSYLIQIYKESISSQQPANFRTFPTQHHVPPYFQLNRPRPFCSWPLIMSSSPLPIWVYSII